MYSAVGKQNVILTKVHYTYLNNIILLMDWKNKIVNKSFTNTISIFIHFQGVRKKVSIRLNLPK